jgi:hypothetical protein
MRLSRRDGRIAKDQGVTLRDKTSDAKKAVPEQIETILKWGSKVNEQKTQKQANRGRMSCEICGENGY